MEFKPIERVSVADEIIELIKKNIFDGNLRPGERLPSEEKMALKFRVGRGTVREALKVLIYMGFIERKNKIAVVAHDFNRTIFPKDIIGKLKQSRNIMEMIEARLIIEPGIAKYAAIKAKTNDIDRIREYFDNMVANLDQLDLFITYNNQFHMSIVQATGNQILKDIMKGIQELMKQNQAFFIRNSEKIKDRSVIYHRKIMEAIEKGDPDFAERQMLEHLLDVEKEMYLIIKKGEM